MRRCTSQTGSSPLWYSTSNTPNSVVPSPNRAMLARVWAGLAVGGELVAGALFVLGLLTPLAGLLVLSTMAVAIAKVHAPKGFFVQNGGYEYNLVLVITALAVVALGPGRFSLDYVLRLAR